MLKFAFRNLLSRPVRSLLSLLGLTVAIVGMVGLFSIAEGLDRMVSSTIDRIPGLVAMQPGAPIPLFSRVPAAWGTEIARVEGVHAVSPEIWQRVNAIDGKMIVSPPRFLFGTDIDAHANLKFSIYRDAMLPERGEFLVSADKGTMHAVVSRQIAEEFDKDVGDTLKVNGHNLTITGIYHCGSLLLDVAIIVDINRVRAMTRFDPSSVSSFYVEQKQGVDDEDLAERITDEFRGRELDTWKPSSLVAQNGSGSTVIDFAVRIEEAWKSFGKKRPADNSPTKSEPDDKAASLPETAPDTADSPPTLAVDDDLPLEVRSAASWADRFEKMSSDLDIFLLLMTGIGVTVAVLSIVNTMLMSVSERIIEFGILKANGWSRRDVLKLVIWESGLLGFCGGVLGCLFGLIATLVVNALWPERLDLYASPQLLTFSLCFSTALGILGGGYPAFWAMRMLPMDAIRRG
jgi:putative ABC transport system permease protein